MPKYGYRALSVVVLAAALCGCGAMDQTGPDRQQQDSAAAHQSCIAHGFTEGTPEMGNCLEAELALIADRRRRGLSQADQQPASPGSGRLCLPTAAGPAFAC